MKSIEVPYSYAWAKEQGCTKLTRPRAKRARGEGTRAHPDAAQRRRHVAEKIAAAGAAAIVGDGTGDIHAQPMASGFAHRIDALHGQAGQVLHSFTSVAAWPGQLRSYLEQMRRRIAESPGRPCCSPRSPEGERLA